MIIGLGIDICENSRISRIYEHYGERFLNKVFMEEEIIYCLAKKNPIPHLTARFAVKEAFIKALGIKRNLNLSYRSVGLEGSQSGKKNLIFSGQLHELYKNSGARKICFSISHAKEYSNAVVIIEK